MKCGEGETAARVIGRESVELLIGDRESQQGGEEKFIQLYDPTHLFTIHLLILDDTPQRRHTNTYKCNLRA